MCIGGCVKQRTREELSLLDNQLLLGSQCQCCSTEVSTDEYCAGVVCLSVPDLYPIRLESQKSEEK